MNDQSEVSGHPPGTRDRDWETCRLSIPVDEIGYLVAIFEGYENQFLVRTETKGLGLLRIWYPAANRPLLEKLLGEMRAEFPVDILGYFEGMDALDEVFPE